MSSNGAPVPETPRIYALDIVLPAEETGQSEPLVIDINGARSGVEFQRQLYGDDRVQEAVLTVLAEAGNGTITTVSQTSTAPLQDRFSAARIRSVSGPRSGWYEASDAYVPLGDPTARGREHTPARIARRLGIDFRGAEVSWAGDRFVVQQPGCDDMELRHWNPDGVLWPYAWDQRVLALPPKAQVCNPLPYALPTTNKLLASCLLGQIGTPLARTAGLWLPDSTHVADLATSFSPERLAVVKPAVGRRSFGVIALPTAQVASLAPDLGLVAEPDQLRRTAELTVIGLLWGQGTELLALAQPYIQPRVRQHPSTNRSHTAIVRATVIADRTTARCVDACAMLAARPVDASRRRDALLLTRSDEPCVVSLDDAEHDKVRVWAEQLVMRLETNVRARLALPEPGATVRAEIDLLVDKLEKETDAPIAAAWRHHSSSINGHEAMSPSYPVE